MQFETSLANVTIVHILNFKLHTVTLSEISHNNPFYMMPNFLHLELGFSLLLFSFSFKYTLNLCTKFKIICNLFYVRISLNAYGKIGAKLSTFQYKAKSTVVIYTSLSSSTQRW